MSNKSTNCGTEKEKQRIKKKHRSRWKRFTKQGSICGREFRTHWESRAGNVWLSTRSSL